MIEVEFVTTCCLYIMMMPFQSETRLKQINILLDIWSQQTLIFLVFLKTHGIGETPSARSADGVSYISQNIPLEPERATEARGARCSCE